MPNKHKKHFGNQAILTAIAKVNGYATYKSLLEDPKPKLKLDSLRLALSSLNPHPLSELQTAIWERFINGIIVALYAGPYLEATTYQNLKKYDETPYLNLIGYGVSYNFYISQISEYQKTYRKVTTPYYISNKNVFSSFASLITVAESVYLTALKKPLTRIMMDAYTPTSNKKVNDALIDTFTVGFKAEPFPFKECLYKEVWEEEYFKEFVKALQEIFKDLFSANLSISGKQRNPLEKIVSVEFDDKYTLYKSNKRLESLHENKQFLERLQEAAIALKGTIDEDDNELYTHRKFQNLSNLNTLKNEELRYSIISNINTAKPTDSTQAGLKALSSSGLM